MPPQNQSKNRKIIASFVVVFAVVILAVGASMLAKKDDTSDTQTSNTSEPSNTSNNGTSETSSATYKDGTYEATGTYTTPGGKESIDLTVTIEDNKVVATSFKSAPKNRQTVEYQGKFKENYTALVVGKKIDDISLNRVSGSSLTSTGFHNALDQIKQQAES